MHLIVNTSINKSILVNTNKGLQMKTFLRLFNKLFTINSQAVQSRIDLYVAAKRPTSVADVDRILQEYQRFVTKGGMYS
jgi:16S rRNA G1207 methylase RsmC